MGDMNFNEMEKQINTLTAVIHSKADIETKVDEFFEEGEKIMAEMRRMEATYLKGAKGEEIKKLEEEIEQGNAELKNCCFKFREDVYRTNDLLPQNFANTDSNQQAGTSRQETLESSSTVKQGPSTENT